MEANIIGRCREKEILERLLASNEPEFLAIYGRRRVGKTFLVKEYFEDRCPLFELTGRKMRHFLSSYRTSPLRFAHISRMRRYRR